MGTRTTQQQLLPVITLQQEANKCTHNNNKNKENDNNNNNNNDNDKVLSIPLEIIAHHILPYLSDRTTFLNCFMAHPTIAKLNSLTLLFPPWPNQQNFFINDNTDNDDDNRICKIHFTNNFFICANQNEEIHVMTSSKGCIFQTLNVPNVGLQSIASYPSTDLLAVGSKTTSLISLWDPVRNQIIAEIDLRHYTETNNSTSSTTTNARRTSFGGHVQWSNDGKLLACSTNINNGITNSIIQIWSCGDKSLSNNNNMTTLTSWQNNLQMPFSLFELFTVEEMEFFFTRNKNNNSYIPHLAVLYEHEIEHRMGADDDDDSDVSSYFYIDHKIVIWNIESGNHEILKVNNNNNNNNNNDDDDTIIPTSHLFNINQHARHIATSPNAAFLAWATQQSLTIWNYDLDDDNNNNDSNILLTRGKPLVFVNNKSLPRHITSIAFDPNGNKEDSNCAIIVVGTGSGDICTFKIMMQQQHLDDGNNYGRTKWMLIPLQRFCCHDKYKSGILSLVFSRNGRTIATRNDRFELWVWDYPFSF